MVKWVKFSGASWDEAGFYYSRYPMPEPGMELSNANKYHSVYYHKVGTPQTQDRKIFEDLSQPLMNHNAGVTEDGRYLILYASAGTSGFETRYRLVKDIQAPFKILFKGYDNESTVITNIGDKFLASTNVHAPNIKIVEIDPKNPDEAQWKTIIPGSRYPTRKF